MPKIAKIFARQIIDSRGNPTLETSIFLDNGITAKASVPSGASTGSHEAVELRDNDTSKYNGKSVYNAIGIVNSKIAKFLKGIDVEDQASIDLKLISSDGTIDKSSFGANSILSVSLACARAASIARNQPLYKYLNSLYGEKIKSSEVIPLFNVINGGLHAKGSVSFQEFFLIPHEQSFSHALETGCIIYHKLKTNLSSLNKNTNIGDEGGFAPYFSKNAEVLDLLKQVSSGYKIGFGLDVASSTFYKNGNYYPEATIMSTKDYIEFIARVAIEYNLEVLEDPLSEDDWVNWNILTANIGNRLKIIGDDLLVTNKIRLAKAIENKSCNGILIKVNQIGTLTETLEVIKSARKSNFSVIISHRSGETNDDFIADLAVGVGADYVKFGAPTRGERVAKYNRLLEIYEQIKGQK